jgi:hypothetical protein
MPSLVHLCVWLLVQREVQNRVFKYVPMRHQRKMRAELMAEDQVISNTQIVVFSLQHRSLSHVPSFMYPLNCRIWFLRVHPNIRDMHKNKTRSYVAFGPHLVVLMQAQGAHASNFPARRFLSTQIPYLILPPALNSHK